MRNTRVILALVGIAATLSGCSSTYRSPTAEAFDRYEAENGGAPLVAAALAPGSLAEAPLAGRIGGRMIAGQVDRLLVEPDRVLVLDYKTNRPPPQDVAAVAPLYLWQMAAYRALLRAAFPGRRVECALVWTYGARVMELPDALLDRHAPGE
jgi:ATP-dependent helicase/nuclease subunit A